MSVSRNTGYKFPGIDNDGNLVRRLRQKCVGKDKAAPIVVRSAISDAQSALELIFVPPGTQEKSLVLSALGTGLRLKIGQIGAASIDPPPRGQLRNQTDCQE
jgi:hypothetical protein